MRAPWVSLAQGTRIVQWTAPAPGITVLHMKTVSIRELHSRTGELVREASHYGEIRITDNGRVIARILPLAEASEGALFRPA